jgi:hypothetical protein
MTTVNIISTEDDVRDLAIAIVDELVEQGMIQDNLDTDDPTEFAFQDVISEAIAKKLNINISN